MSIQAEASRLPLSDASNAILTFCAELLEHVPDPELPCSANCRGSLALGDCWCSPCPTALRAPGRRSAASSARASRPGTSSGEYTLDSLIEAAERTGFHTVSAGSRWFLVYWLAFGIERNRLAAPAARAMLRPRRLSRLTGRILEELMLLETSKLGLRSRRGIGIFLIARKETHPVHV